MISSTGRGRGGEGRRRDVEGIGGSTGRGGRTASRGRMSMGSGGVTSRGAGKEVMSRGEKIWVGGCFE